VSNSGVTAVRASLRRSSPTLTFQVQMKPTHNVYNFTIFYELLKSYREGIRVGSRTSLLITHKFMILRVACRWCFQSSTQFIS